MNDYPIWPSTLPTCPVASGIIRRVAAAGPDYVERLWVMSKKEMQTIRELAACCFAEGFAVSRESFNAESMSKFGPDGLSLSELSDTTIDCILEDEKISGSVSLAGLRWIPVSERLPEEDCLVLWFRPDERWPVSAGRVCLPHHVDEGGDLEVPFSEGRYTHWMPLPEPPSA